MGSAASHWSWPCTLLPSTSSSIRTKTCGECHHLFPFFFAIFSFMDHLLLRRVFRIIFAAFVWNVCIGRPRINILNWIPKSNQPTVVLLHWTIYTQSQYLPNILRAKASVVWWETFFFFFGTYLFMLLVAFNVFAGCGKLWHDTL